MSVICQMQGMLWTVCERFRSFTYFFEWCFKPQGSTIFAMLALTASMGLWRCPAVLVMAGLCFRTLVEHWVGLLFNDQFPLAKWIAFWYSYFFGWNSAQLPLPPYQEISLRRRWRCNNLFVWRDRTVSWMPRSKENHCNCFKIKGRVA